MLQFLIPGEREWVGERVNGLECANGAQIFLQVF